VLCALHNTEVSYRRWLVKPLEFQTETGLNSALAFKSWPRNPVANKPLT
jgi:hypothetical protein